MEFRHRTIDFPTTNTCDWLFANKRYLAWLERTDLENHHGLLWIKGYPGSGKSTLLKEAVRRFSVHYEPNRRRFASFFFNARGDELERTQLGLFRSLLYQLLPVFPKDLADFVHVHSLKLETSSSIVDWQLQELRVRLHAIFMQASSTDITIFIDAVDECQDDARGLVKFLRNLTTAAYHSKSDLSVCISGRIYPTITINGCPEIDVGDFNYADISTYVYEKMSPNLRTKSFESGSRLALEEEIVARANGIFLWAVLVVDILLRRHDDGVSIPGLRRILREEIPKELEGVYGQMLENLSHDEREQSLHLFQWALFAARPLRLSEWSHVLAIITKPYEVVGHESPISLDRVESGDQLAKLVRKLSCGLLDMRALGNPAFDLKPDDADSLKGGAGSFEGETIAVQMIHESVRTFLLGSKGFPGLEQYLGLNVKGSAHLYILTSCVEYIVGTPMGRRVPFDLRHHVQATWRLFETYADPSTHRY